MLKIHLKVTHNEIDTFERKAAQKIEELSKVISAALVKAEDVESLTRYSSDLGEHLDQISAARERMDAAKSPRLLLRLASIARVGKSTVVEKLVGMQVSKVGPKGPTTIVPHEILIGALELGDSPKYELHNADGHQEVKDLTELHSLVCPHLSTPNNTSAVDKLLLKRTSARILLPLGQSLSFIAVGESGSEVDVSKQVGSRLTILDAPGHEASSSRPDVNLRRNSRPSGDLSQAQINAAMETKDHWAKKTDAVVLLLPWTPLGGHTQAMPPSLIEDLEEFQDRPLYVVFTPFPKHVDRKDPGYNLEGFLGRAKNIDKMLRDRHLQPRYLFLDVMPETRNNFEESIGTPEDVAKAFVKALGQDTGRVNQYLENLKAVKNDGGLELVMGIIVTGVIRNMSETLDRRFREAIDEIRPTVRYLRSTFRQRWVKGEICVGNLPFPERVASNQGHQHDMVDQYIGRLREHLSSLNPSCQSAIQDAEEELKSALETVTGELPGDSYATDDALFYHFGARLRNTAVYSLRSFSSAAVPFPEPLDGAVQRLRLVVEALEDLAKSAKRAMGRPLASSGCLVHHEALKPFTAPGTAC